MGIGDSGTETMEEKEKQLIERKKVMEQVAKQDLGFVCEKKKHLNMFRGFLEDWEACYWICMFSMLPFNRFPSGSFTH